MTVRIYDAEMGDESTEDVLWPDERPYSWLMKKKAVMPRAMYNTQYRNNPSGLKGVRYSLDVLQYWTEETCPPLTELVGVQSGDPATSKEQSANYFGHCTAGKHLGTNRIYVLDFAFAHIDATEHLEFLKAHYQTWQDRGLNVQKVLLESGGPQQATTQRLLEDARLDTSTSMPVEEVNPKGSKEQKFDSLLPYFSNGTILIAGEAQGDEVEISSSPGFVEFQREYTSFPKGGRDDLLDALYLVVNNIVNLAEAANISESELTDEELETSEEEKKQARMREYEVERYEDQAKERLLSVPSLVGRPIGLRRRF